MSWKTLYVGPANFNADSWKTRAEYILPDLFAATGEDAQIHLLTARVPDFAREALEKLLERFGVQHYEMQSRYQKANRTERWIEEVTTFAQRIRPDVITNVFGSQWLGEVIAAAAAASGSRSVIRVPGDEIGSRLAMGVYQPGTEELRSALGAERAGFLAADRVIAMSPWEADRIRAAIGTPTDKVAVCIRGIDLERFRPPAMADEPKAPRRFLFVGRKSAEKGYDLVEAAARRVHEVRPDVEFVFVGSFEPQRIDNRTYLGWVETQELPQLYQGVDAFVLTSRSEGFPQVVAEAMASGRPCILSRHLFGPVFQDGEDALLCELDEQDIARKILRLVEDPKLAARLARRSREIAESELDQQFWTRRYKAIMHLQPVQEATVFDRSGTSERAMPPEPGAIVPGATATRPRPRLLFVTPRPLGMIATPGTYLSVEGYAEHCEVEVVAKPVTSPGEIIVHTPSRALPTTLLDPDQEDFEERVKDVIRRFQPDILCVASWLRLPRLVRAVREEFPRVKICLEVKSPVLNPDPVKREQNLARWQRVENCFDAIIAPARGMVDTYLPNFRGPFLQHRSVLDYGRIAKKELEADIERVICRKLVFSGSLAPLRQIDRLLELIARLPLELRQSLQVDFYGDGSARADLERYADKLGLTGSVRFLGAVQQEKLFQLYRNYDAGIAWVPRELYDSAPSLKLIEYCAAGIAPVATSSGGHLLLREHGFHIDYFDEHDEQAFAHLLTRVSSEGVHAPRLRENIRLAEKFDYRSVIGEEILPFYQRIASPLTDRQPSAAPRRGVAAAPPSFEEAVQAWRQQARRDAAQIRRRAPGGLDYERSLHALRMRGQLPAKN